MFMSWIVAHLRQTLQERGWNLEIEIAIDIGVEIKLTALDQLHYCSLDFLGGMGGANILEFQAAIAGPNELTSFLDEARPHHLGVTAPQLIETLSSILPDVDKACLTGEFADEVIASIGHGLEPGIAGWRDDDLAFAKPWGFELGALRNVPVAVWQGDSDLMVPFAHGQWLAANIPRARPHLKPNEGHLSVFVTHFRDVLDDMLANAQ